jgi:hypothetical protein
LDDKRNLNKRGALSHKTSAHRIMARLKRALPAQLCGKLKKPAKNGTAALGPRAPAAALCQNTLRIA